MRKRIQKMVTSIRLKSALPLLLTVLGLGLEGHCQETVIRQDLLSFPVSPEAAKLGTFGKTPVNLFFGQLNKSVDLFQGTEGDFSVPVRMSYSYSGCRVEESPSIAGLGWQLSLGGVVAREVRGLPDEHPNGYYKNPLVGSILNTYFTSGTMTIPNGKKIMEGGYDSEADLYTVGANGISFSFKIASNGSPVFMSKHNYRVDIARPANPTCVADILGFTVTDTNGNKYNFSTKETNEGIGATGDGTFSDAFPNYTSSWQLSSITLNNGTPIVYTYADDNFNSYSYFATGVYRGLTGGGTTLYDAGVRETIIKRKILTSITANAFKIALTTATLNNHKVYSQLTVKNVRDEVVHTYSFTYTGSRNLLKRIDYNGQFFYGFDYHNETGMPGFINSVQQFPKYFDEWGFYNGANNTYLLNIPATQYVADKEPSFNHTLMGALSKIKYPTGGSTDVYYEQNVTYSPQSQNTDPNVRLHLAFKSDNVLTAPEVKTEIFTKTFATDMVAIMDHRMETNNGGPIQFSITPTSGCQSSVNHYQLIAIDRAYGVDTPNVCLKLFALMNDGCMQGNCVETQSSNGKFIIRAGTYEFKFIAEQNRYTNKLVKAMVNIDFYDPAVADSLGISYSIKKIGGIRVVRTIDNPLIGNPITTNFEYGGAGESSSLVNRISYQWKHGTPGTGLGTIETWNATEYNAKSYNPLLLSGTPAFNGLVKTYTHKEEVIIPKRFRCTSCSGGFSNYDGQLYYSYLGGVYGTKKVTYGKGFVLNSFEGPRRYPSNTYPFVPVGQDKSLGTPKSTQVYAPTATDGTEKILTEESNSYMYSNTSNWAAVYNNPDLPKSLRMGYKIKRTGLTQDYAYDTVNTFYLLSTYDKDIDSESYLSNVTSKEFLAEVPVENSKAYTYDGYLQPKRITTYASDGSSIAAESSYPYDFSDSVFPTMVTKNCISPVVQVVTKNNEAVTETLKYEYTNVLGGLFKPGTYLRSKGTAALEVLARYGYDNSGNLTMQRRILNLPDSQNDPNVTIVWGYKKTLPLVKFENPGGILIPPATIATLQGISDTGTEDDLLTALKSFRDSFPTAIITTYTHKPLVGVSTITGPTGQILYYNYDNQGRLINVKEKDASGNMNILTENTYRYKTQN